MAAPASAAISDCPSGRTCLWKDFDYASGGYGGSYFPFANGVRNFANYNFPNFQGPLNDNVTSVYNNGNSQYSYMYTDAGFNNLMLQLATKSGSRNLSGGSNDSMSSGGFQFCIQNPSSSLCD